MNIIHAQLRMECSNLNSHLFKLHVIDDPKCLCSFKLEDNAHFFLHCPLYLIQRNKLKKLIEETTVYKLNTLLYGDVSLSREENTKIIECVHTFIEESGRL